MKAKFQVGDYVYHLGAERTGRVTDVFWDGFGPRYYVEHSWMVWSIPESSLLFDTTKNQQVSDREKTERENAGSKS